jgi:hypothetical protein
MEFKGRIIDLLPEQSGTGKNGTWKKQDVIVETGGRFPRKVCVSVWGDKIDKNILKEGAVCNFFINVESREFKGRWYTDVKAWKIDLIELISGDNNLPEEQTVTDMHQDDDELNILPF